MDSDSDLGYDSRDDMISEDEDDDLNGLIGLLRGKHSDDDGGTADWLKHFDLQSSVDKDWTQLNILPGGLPPSHASDQQLVSPLMEMCDWFQDQVTKDSNRSDQSSESLELPDVEDKLFSMSREQRIVVLSVLYHHWLLEQGEEPGYLRLVASGTAGTGKSHIIKLIMYLLRTVYGNNKCTATVGPSGSSASLVLGSTIQSFAKTPAHNGRKNAQNMNKPGPQNLSDLQKRCDGLTTLMIDEFSMCGAETVGWTEWHLRHAMYKGQNVKEPWGNLRVLLFLGDAGQLPQVLESSLWDESESKSSGKPFPTAATQGKHCFRSISQGVWLSQVQRQQKSPCVSCSSQWHKLGEMCSLLKETLMKMRFESLEKKDWEWLKQFTYSNLSQERKNLMDTEAIWIFPTREKSHARNVNVLSSMNSNGTPVVYCKSVNRGSCATRGQKDNKGLDKDVQGLPNRLVLCVGAKVSLTYNLHVAWNLFNGSQGTIVDIVYFGTRKPSVDGSTFPDLILVRFPGYKGPALVPWDPKVVPIRAVELQCECVSKKQDGFRNSCGGCCSRRQIPLSPCYGTTIHKCQGMTVGPGHPFEYLVADMGCAKDESRFPGMGFVALSRVTDISRLAIGGVLDFDRLASIGKSSKSQQVRNLDAKLKDWTTVYLQKYHFLDNDDSMYYLVNWALSHREDSTLDLSTLSTPDWVTVSPKILPEMS